MNTKTKNDRRRLADDAETTNSINGAKMRVGDKRGKNPPANPTKEEPLKGYYFHRIVDDRVTWQGVVLRQFGDYVLVLTFEWLLGNTSCSCLIKVSDLVWNDATKTGFCLYDDHELFKYSYEYGQVAMAHRNRYERNNH
jgi:hypothetical protein